MTAKDIQTRLRSLGNPKDAAFLAGFFKTGPGQYGEGDVFIGVRVPVIRKVAKDFKGLPLRRSGVPAPLPDPRRAAGRPGDPRHAGGQGRRQDQEANLRLLPRQHEVHQQLGLGGPVGPADRRGLPGGQEPQTALPARQVVMAVGSPDQHLGDFPFHPGRRFRRHTDDCGNARWPTAKT